MARQPSQPRLHLRPLLLLSLLAAVSGGAPAGTPAAAQDLIGCQLVGATLQCVPGVTESPQQQILDRKSVV